MPALIETSVLCQHWPVIKPHAHEILELSDETLSDIEDSNEARPTYGCKEQSNEAKTTGT